MYRVKECYIDSFEKFDDIINDHTKLMYYMGDLLDKGYDYFNNIFPQSASKFILTNGVNGMGSVEILIEDLGDCGIKINILEDID